MSNVRVFTVDRKGEQKVDIGSGITPYYQSPWPTGWRLSVRTDVNWHFECHTYGPRKLRFVQCVPLRNRPNSDADWMLAKLFPASSKPEEYDVRFGEEDQFFYAQVEGEGGAFDVLQGYPDASSCELKDGGRAVYLYWNFQSTLITIVSQ